MQPLEVESEIFHQLRRALQTGLSTGAIILAALALVGWIVAISEISSKSSLHASTSAQIEQLTAARQQLSAELDQQKASGTLADLQKKIAETTAAADEAAQDRDAAGIQLGETNKAIEAAKSTLTDTAAQPNAVTEQLAAPRRDGKQAGTEQGSSGQTRQRHRHPHAGTGRHQPAD